MNILLYLLKHGYNKFFDKINKEIKYFDYEVIRIHSEGEFFSTEYLKEWLQIARQNKTTKFYAYTKNFDIFNNVKLPRNFYLLLSYDINCNYEIPVELLNIGKVNVYLTYKTENDINDFIVKYPMFKDKIRHCKGKCSKCKQCYKTKGGYVNACKIH